MCKETPGMAETYQPGDILQIIGGVAKGGIIVRTGKGTTSQKEQALLATGSVVRALELDDCRLQYELVSGSGPSSGWISTKFQGKNLLVETDFKLGASVPTSQWEQDIRTTSGTNAEVESYKNTNSQARVDQYKKILCLSELGNLETEPSFVMLSPERQEALRRYGARFGAQPAKTNAKPASSGYKLAPAYSCAAPFIETRSHEARIELEHHFGIKDGVLEGRSEPWMQRIATMSGSIKSRWQLDAAAVTDENSVYGLCHQCHLPLGERCYMRDQKRIHGECMAQLMVESMREEDNARLHEEQLQKASVRLEYGIGWSAEKVPQCAEVLSKLVSKELQEGMVCIVFNEKTNRVCLASTTEPAASVNLEYLSTALQVRRQHGSEPIFSLDPVEPSNSQTMQAKVFMPEWLEGTSVGEVLFQADYYLKELSMGECEQPVIGMKSCLDFSELEGFAESWSGREWFTVRKAEVHMSEDNVLIPFVKMGVEAREQVLNGERLVDATLTRPDHPLVKYAEQFTKNFDLIAERRSVIFHLRELAKASVLAKFLLEGNVELEGTWLQLSMEKGCCSSLEVPQMWNNRVQSKIQMQDQQILTSDAVVRGVFGGVEFGLDRFDLFSTTKLASATAPLRRSMAGLPPMSYATAAASPFLPPPQSLAVPLASMQSLPAPLLDTAAARSAPMLLSSMTQYMTPEAVTLAAVSLWKPLAKSGDPLKLGPQFDSTDQGTHAVVMAGDELSHLVPAGTALATSTEVGGFVARPTRRVVRLPDNGRLQLKGVDLRLDNFDLREVKRVKMETPTELEKCIAFGDAFWSGLAQDPSVFKQEDKSLLEAVFCERLSDRRIEGDKFIPPDASYSYVVRLRELIKQETELRRQRKEHFLSESFKIGNPGPLFPSSWTSSIDIAQGHAASYSFEGRGQETLYRRRDYEKEAPLLTEAVKSITPVFDKCTEDGMRFQIFRIDCLELRSTRQVNADDEIGAVFSIHSPQQTAKHSRFGKSESIGGHECFVKATEYVERAFSGILGAGCSTLYHRYYLVLDTEKGNKVLTEMLCDGTVTLVYHEDFNARNSAAKVTSSIECSNGTTVDQLKAFREKASQDVVKDGANSATCRRYVQDVADFMSGEGLPNSPIHFGNVALLSGRSRPLLAA